MAFPVELLESGWLLALAPALVLIGGHVRERRRSRRLNRALHELRRPLQALALASSNRDLAASEGFLRLAISALGDLDRTVNGTEDAGERQEPVSCRDLVVAAIGRWRAGNPGLEIQLYWDAGAATAIGSPERLAQALDNLIANAIEHGRPPLSVTGCVISTRLRITISDRGSKQSANGSGLNGDRPDPVRRGHGLELVSEVAASHGGRFALSRSRDGTVAALELPLADPVAGSAA